MSAHELPAPDRAAPAPWHPVGPWDGLVRPGRHGNPDGPPGVVVRTAQPASAALLTTPPARQGALAAALEARFAMSLPRTPRLERGAGMSVRWAGPCQWLAATDNSAATGVDSGPLAPRLAEALGDSAQVADEGSARAVLRLSGPRVRDVLAKGCMIDLDPRVFAPGTVALTVVAHMTVHLVRVDDGERDGRKDRDAVFELSVGRSLAGSLWHWLERSAEAVGMAVPAAEPKRNGFFLPSRAG